MARPRTPIGSFGALVVQEMKPGTWRARARYRFDDGKLRQIERFAASKAKARAALQLALTTASRSAATDVQRETRLGELADRFLASKADRAPRTVDTYRQTVVHHIKPKLGSLSVSEATTDRLGRFIQGIASENGPGAAKACRAVLSGMLAIAARADVVRVNPVREVQHITRNTRGAVAIPLDDLPVLVEAVKADTRLVELDQADLIVFMANTGCRVGEACAMAWEDVDLEAGTATIRANVVRANGVGIVRQDHTKTRAGGRTIALPPSLVDLLVQRRVQSANALVFPTVLGNLRDPRNTSRDWAMARGRLGFPTVTTHSFRKTIATGLDQAGLSARAVAEYLGHESPSLTQDVYMAKNTGGRQAAIAIDALTAPH